MPEIDDDDKQPVFKPIFGDSWDSLPIVIRKHYANRPYSNDLVTVEGTLDVTCGRVFRIFRPLLHLLGEGNAEEIAVDNDTFDMHVDISHPWWGKIYEYQGQFRITREA